MKKKNVIILIIAVIFLAGGAYMYFKKDTTQVVSYRTAHVEKGDVRIDVTATGTINADTTVLVGTQVSGTIAKIFVDFNSRVRQGQIIALIDTTFLAAALEDARAMAQKAQIAVDQSKRDYDRIAGLYKQKVVAATDYEQAQTAYGTAVSNLRSATAQVSRAKINLQYATIKAPISGVVISRKVDVGQTVAASFNTPTLFTIANDLTKMQVQANIDEADIGQVKLGQDVFFIVDAYPNDSFVGKVTQIRLEPVTIQNVVNYIVIIEVPNPDMRLMPGMTANITVKVDEHKNILRVPASALKFSVPDQSGSKSTASTEPKPHPKPNGSSLWVKNGEKFEERLIKAGLSDGSFTEVSGEIKQGDEVVTGMNSVKAEDGQTSQNPFMPRMRPPSSSGAKK